MTKQDHTRSAAALLTLALLAAVQSTPAQSGASTAAGKARAQAAATALPATSPALPSRQPFEPEMVAIPAGRLVMGSPATEAERRVKEGPQHEVTVPAFELGKYEITFAQ